MQQPFSLAHTDHSWTLFLDRDGVINHEKDNDYILNTDELVLYEGVPAAMAVLANYFQHIVVATNQKGVGKGLMTLADLEAIHQKMLAQIQAAGGRIDHIYFCTDLADDAPNRKPQPGMALQAAADYPAIQLTKSIMVGNRPSDMAFGRNAGMHTVFLATTHPETAFPHPLIDLRFDHLPSFTQSVQALRKA